MPTYDHDHDHLDAEAVRPSPNRGKEQNAVLWRAAVAGRTDVIGRSGMLSIQRAAGNQAARELGEEQSPVLDVVSSGGQSLEEPVRQDMEARLGHDFGDVRLHTDDAADSSARSVHAHAYTVGSNIVFQRGAYDPGSPAGQTLLAHELTHVVQQRSGPVDGTSTGDGIKVSDPSDRFEREAAATADRVMSRPAPSASLQAGAGPASVGTDSMQREAEEEEELQGAFVQREAEEEEELQGAFVQRAEDEDEDELSE